MIDTYTNVSLTRDHEQSLARRYLDSQDMAALESLVMAQARSVDAMARRYRGYGLDHADLVSEGLVGLLEAAKRFDPDRGLRFFTYARHWARARMLAFILRHWSIVAGGTGAQQSKLFFQLRRRHSELEARHGVDSTAAMDELCAEFGLTPAEARSALDRLRRRDSSLDAPLSGEAGTSFVDILPANDQSPAEEVSSAQTRAQVRAVVDDVWNELSPREQLILEKRMMASDKAMSLAEIGRTLGITRERVRQIEVGIKETLRRRFAVAGSLAA